MEALIEEMLDGKILLAEAVDEFEKIYIQKSLERNGGRLIKTARSLGIHRNTLSTRLAGYGASKPRNRSSQLLKKQKARAAGR